MGMIQRITSLILFIILLGATPAWAVQPLPFEGTYHFSWNGLRFGKLHIRSGPKQIETTIKITGIARIFAPHKSTSAVTFAELTSCNKPEYCARIYETRYESNKEPRHVKLAYDTTGQLVEEIVEPVEDPAHRPPPAQAEKNGVVEPLTLVLALREALQETPESATVKMFDGRRLMRIHLLLQNRAVTCAGKAGMLYSLSRTPIAGYTQKELQRLKKDPKATACLSRDMPGVPLELSATMALGTLKATLLPSSAGGQEPVGH